MAVVVGSGAVAVCLLLGETRRESVERLTMSGKMDLMSAGCGCGAGGLFVSLPWEGGILCVFAWCVLVVGGCRCHVVRIQFVLM